MGKSLVGVQIPLPAPQLSLSVTIYIYFVYIWIKILWYIRSNLSRFFIIENVFFILNFKFFKREISSKMHERSIAKNLLHIVLDKVKNYDKKDKVELIRIVVGEFTMIQEELLVSAFYQLSESTVAEGAKIEIIHTHLRGKCQECGKEFMLNKDAFRCPFCDSGAIQIISGNELFIQDIEINNNNSY